MAHTFGYLPDQANEDALHSERLLFIEEKPFHRVTRRLLGEDSLLRHTPRQLPSPPPEGDDGEERHMKEEEAVQPFSRDKFWHDVLIDFAALQSSITRIQLIHSSNERERERYASEKNKILASSQAVRDNTIVLRAQLAEAQRILELRKGYDTLASKILDDKKLKSREEARQEIATLEKEIEELQAEGRNTDALWTVRKEGFERVVEEGRAYIRAIKGIKDEPEQGTEEDEEMGDAEDDTRLTSTAGTPRPDGASTPRPESGSATPLPAHENGDAEHDGHVPSRLREAETLNDEIEEDESLRPTTQATDEQMGDPEAETQASEALQSNTDSVEDEVAPETMDET